MDALLYCTLLIGPFVFAAGIITFLGLALCRSRHEHGNGRR